MGNLVFQATLGGQVNLVGPNTASTFNLNVPAVAGTLVTTGDTGTVTNTMCATSVYTAPGTIGSGTPNSGAFTTLSANSNVTFSGAGAKIAGDFSNATLTSRAAFQTSTTNGSTGIYALPNGTSTAASWQATNAADPTNASKILIATNGSTDVQLVSGINGTGTYLPLTFYTNGAEKMRLDTSGNLGLGVTPSAWYTSNNAKAIELVNAGNGILQYGTGTNTTSYYLNNAYLNTSGSFIYGQSGTASSFWRQVNGVHSWGTAPSGTAGGTISFTTAMTLDASGNLLVGTTSQISAGKQTTSFSGATSNGLVLSESTNTSSSGYIYFNNGASTIGSISRVGATAAVVYSTTSDQRLKSNIENSVSVLDKLMQVQVRQFDWTEGDLHQDYGFIAQELDAVLSGIVTKGKTEEDVWQLDYSRLTPHLVKAIQEQQAIITQLQADVEALKAPK